MVGEEDGIAPVRSVAAVLSAGRGIAEVNQAVLKSALDLSGGERAVLVVRDATGLFEIVAATDPHNLGDRMAISELASPLWPVLLCRSRLRWSASEQPAAARPLPFVGEEGWSHLTAVGLPFRGRQQGFLAIGRDAGGPFDGIDSDSLELLATLCAIAIDNARMEHSLQALGTLLSAAVDVAARTVDAQSPDEIQRILLEGLVKDMGMTAAALWEPLPDGGGMELTHSLGLPSDVRQRMLHIAPDSTVARLYADRLNIRLLHGATSHVSTVWPGTQVRLIRVGPPASGVLGVYSTESLPDPVDGVLATLSQALSRAVQQSMMHRRTQQVADALMRELAPHSITAPEGLEVGFVYQSATKGVPIGGDFIDWFVTETGDIGIACGDVSGKGVDAASLTAMAVYSLRAFALGGAAPDHVLTQLNKAICNQTTAERFATVVYAVVNPESGRLLVSLAGHPRPAMIRENDARLLDVTADVPTGILPRQSFASHETTLESGDSIVLVTDGVTEARRVETDETSPIAAMASAAQEAADALHGAEGVELLGEAGLLDALRGRAGSTAQQIADAVWSRVVEWTGGGTTDDCAIVVLRRR